MSNSKSNTPASPKTPMEVCLLDQSTEDDDNMQEEREVVTRHKEDKEDTEDKQDKRPEGPRKNNLGKT